METEASSMSEAEMFWGFNNPQSISKLGERSKSHKNRRVCECLGMQIWIVENALGFGCGQLILIPLG